VLSTSQDRTAGGAQAAEPLHLITSTAIGPRHQQLRRILQQLNAREELHWENIAGIVNIEEKPSY